MNGFHLPYDHLPLFLPYPESLLTMDMSITECRVYMLILRRSHLSARSERWVDGDGRVFLYYPIRDLARALRRSGTSVKKALNALKEKDLILRVRQGAGKPNRIYVKIPMEEGPWDPETDATGASGTDTLPSPGGDTPGVPRMDGKVAPSKIDREERNAEERGKDRPAPDPAPGESPFLPGEAGEGEAYGLLTGIRQPLRSELRLTDPGKGGEGLPPCASRPRRERAGDMLPPMRDSEKEKALSLIGGAYQCHETKRSDQNRRENGAGNKVYQWRNGRM